MTIKVWEAIDSALTSRLHYGEGHPQAGQRFEAAWSLVRRALEETDAGVLWNVTPYSFHVGDLTIWEPRDQLDWIPYRAFASGIRAMAIVPGLTQDEFSGFLNLLSMDPLAEMAPEDDLVTLLWERGYKNVLYREVDTYSEGEQADREEFEEQRREVAAFIRAAKQGGVEIDFSKARSRATGFAEVEAGMGDAAGLAAARAQAASAMRARDAASSSPVSEELVTLDDAAVRMLRAQLERGAGTTGERFVFAAVHGYVWATGQGRQEDLAHALRMTTEGVAQSNPAASLQLAESLIATLRLRDPANTEQRRGELATALMSADVVRSVRPIVDEAGTKARERFERILAYVREDNVPDYLELGQTLRGGPTLDAICGVIGRCAKGNEERIGDILETARPVFALALCKMLKSLGTVRAGQALERAANNPDPVVQLEAMSARGGSTAPSATRTRQQLQALLIEDSGIRAQTLPTIVASGMKGAAPVLVAMIRDKAFDRRALDDRRQIFDALAELQPDRAEPVALELLTEKRLVSMGAHEETRELAAKVLGRIARSNHTLEALVALSKTRFGVSVAVREAAEAAAAAMRRRAREEGR
jgi:hypothetical protein